MDAALIAITTFFGIYGLACSIECGIAITMLNPLSKARKYFVPLWEVTNVFLIFGFIGLSVLFSHSLSLLSSALLSSLAFGLIALLARSCLGLAIFYVDSKRLRRTLAWLFVVVSFSVPLIFAAAGAYLLTGQLFWQSLTGLFIILATFLGVTAMGLLAVDRSNSQSSLLSNELIFTAWLLVLGSVLPLSAVAAMPHLQKLPLLVISFLGIVGLFLALLKMTARPQLKLWKVAAAITFLAPLLLALANRPYLVAGKVTLAQAYSGQAYVNIFVIGTFVMLPLIALGFWLFWKLLRNDSKTEY